MSTIYNKKFSYTKSDVKLIYDFLCKMYYKIGLWCLFNIYPPIGAPIKSLPKPAILKEIFNSKKIMVFS